MLSKDTIKSARVLSFPKPETKLELSHETLVEVRVRVLRETFDSDRMLRRRVLRNETILIDVSKVRGE